MLVSKLFIGIVLQGQEINNEHKYLTNRSWKLAVAGLRRVLKRDKMKAKESGTVSGDHQNLNARDNSRLPHFKDSLQRSRYRMDI
jgi:hypothetical protein